MNSPPPRLIALLVQLIVNVYFDLLFVSVKASCTKITLLTLSLAVLKLMEGKSAAESGARTHDRRNTSRVLSKVSYPGIPALTTTVGHYISLIKLCQSCSECCKSMYTLHYLQLSSESTRDPY